MRQDIQLDDNHHLTDTGCGDYELVCRVKGHTYQVPRVGEAAFVNKTRGCPLCNAPFARAQVPTIDPNDQPDEATKLSRMQGGYPGWDYCFKAPPVNTRLWTDYDWIRFIGDRWFRVDHKPPSV